MNASGDLLRIEDLDFAYPGFPKVLDSIDFSLENGELMTLLGPNGAGKSTLLNCIMGLVKPDSGTILLQGQPISHVDTRSVAQSIAYVQQHVTVNFAYTVEEYVAMGRAPHLKLHQKPGAHDFKIVDAALERLGITHLAKRIYNQLSGGQRQLVDVARAITQDPKLILFDEPTSALDYGNQMKVLEMIKELSAEGYAMIMTTHNPDHPILLGGSVCVLDKKGHLKKGCVEEIMTEDMLSDLYGVDLLIRYVVDAGRKVCMAPAF